MTHIGELVRSLIRCVINLSKRDVTSYLSYTDAVLIHILLMRLSRESHYGVFDRALVESALARPKQARAYEGADF